MLKRKIYETLNYDDFVNHSLETVDELLPQARVFVETLISKIEGGTQRI